MPQKRLAESIFIKKMLQSCFPSSLLYEWQEISGLMHTEVLKILADARIFLSLQRFDGFGLPALEAMAAGCLVTGFNGQGGAEYANEKNGFWVKEDDIIGAAHSLAKAIWILRERPEEAAVMIASGQQAASLYTETARDTAVCEVYSKILSKQNVVN